MALILPSPPQMPFRPAGTKAQPRLTRFRFDLLGPRADDGGNVINEALIGTVDGVESGYVKFDGWGTVKAGGTLEMVDTGQEIDWLTSRVRPMALIQTPEGAEEEEIPIGVFLASAPVENWTTTGRRWSVELMDKLSILDQDIATDSSGNPVAYALPSGSNVIQTVKSLITSTGESSPAIVPSSKVTSNPMVWEVGTTKLRIITDLLNSADFFPLDTDGYGNYRTAPYIDPSDRPLEYESVWPFGKDTLVGMDWTSDHDIYAIPNRMVAIGQGSQDAEAPVAVVTNEDPDSPFSYQARGRWITTVDTGVECVDQAALLSYARRRMTMLSHAATEISIKHLFLPDIRVGAVVMFETGGSEIKVVVRTTEVPFDPLGLVSTILRRV